MLPSAKAAAANLTKAAAAPDAEADAEADADARFLQEEAAEAEDTEEAEEADEVEDDAGEMMKEREDKMEMDVEGMKVSDMMRVMTTAEDLEWSISFADLEDGMRFEYGCLATSLHPSMPKYMSEGVRGEVETQAEPVEDTGAEFLWCSLITFIFAAIFMF